MTLSRGAAFGDSSRLIGSWPGVAEVIRVNKLFSPARRLGELVSRCLSGTLARQGFASTELVTRWSEIVGPEIADHAEPIKIQWSRRTDHDSAEPATLRSFTSLISTTSVFSTKLSFGVARARSCMILLARHCSRM